MSQPMNFSPDIKILSGGELPPNSVTLVYSPSCPHCHNILGQYNQLPGLAGGKFSVNAVNLMDHYHSLRAGGIEVGGVPQILIRGGSSEILEYGGPRMAESIAKDALGFLSGGERLSGGRIFGGDMLLGGANSEEVVLEGGKRRRRSRSRKSRRRMRGGAEEDLSGGKRRSRRSRNRHPRRRLRGGEEEQQPVTELEGGRRRRSRSRSRSRRFRGGEVSAVEAPKPAELNGGRRSRAGGWIAHVKSYRRAHPSLSYGQALKKAAPSWRRS